MARAQSASLQVNIVMRWTETQLETYLAKQPMTDISGDIWQDADEGPESKLQSKIKAWCKTWGRPILSFPRTPKVRRFLPPGWPDDCIVMPGSRVLWIEDKTKSGRPSPEQIHLHLVFRALGHEVHVVRSFKRFLEIVGN